MTHRDFCYWLQGYFEITGKGTVVTIGVWNTIVEHLFLTMQTGEPSEDIFTCFVNHLWGFVQINGRQRPGDEQWDHIKSRVADLFEKVTSATGEYDAADILAKIRKRRGKETPAEEVLEQAFKDAIDSFDEMESEQPVKISPWDENTPICTAEPHGHKLCAGRKDDTYCLSAGDTYPEQPGEALGRNPLK